MTIKAPKIEPDHTYGQQNEAKYRESIRQALLQAHDKRQALPLMSPNGSTFLLTVSDAGQLALLSPDGTSVDV